MRITDPMKLSADAHYEAGIAEGRRLERRALKWFVDNQIPDDSTYGRWVRNWLKTRTARSKRVKARNP